MAAPTASSTSADDAAPGVPAGLRLVGGEMPTGHDRPTRPDAVAAALVTAALAALRSHSSPGSGPPLRVLLAGPYGPQVLEAVAPHDGVRAESLLRSLPDATELCDVVPAGHDVTAGGLDRFGSDRTFELVVALDGTRRLTGPDSEDLSWTDSVRRLRDLVAPGGLLLLGVDNPCSSTRLLAGPHPPTDDDWPRPAGVEVDGPPLQRLPTALDALGLPVGACFATVAGGRLVADDGLLRDLGPRSALIPVVRRLVRRAAAGTEPLSDPGGLAATLAARGLLAATADGWWLVAGDRHAYAALSVPGLWIDGVAVDPDALPTGTGLPDLIAEAYAVEDSDRIRALLRDYVARVGSLGPHDPDDVLIAADGSVKLDPGTRTDGDPAPTAPTTPAEAVTRLADRLMTLGVGSDLPDGSDLAAFARRLGVLAGLPESELDAVRTPQRSPYAGIRQARDEVERLDTELRQARAQLDWADRELAKVRHSVSFRVGSLVTTPARVVYRQVRKRRHPNTFTPEPVEPVDPSKDHTGRP